MRGERMVVLPPIQRPRSWYICVFEINLPFPPAGNGRGVQGSVHRRQGRVQPGEHHPAVAGGADACEQPPTPRQPAMPRRRSTLRT
eukprot:scaffold1735_cov119-Isochrysis_galbana.AAC.12